MAIAKKRLVSHHIFKFISFFVGLMFCIWPISSDIGFFRPEFVCMLVIYWTLHTPLNTSLGYVWLVGLSQDIVEGTVWCAHAIALTLVAFVCLSSYRRIRSFSVGHQALWVLMLVGAHQVLASWIQSLSFDTPSASFSTLIAPALISMVFWPIVSYVLFRLRYQRIHFR